MRHLENVNKFQILLHLEYSDIPMQNPFSGFLLEVRFLEHVSPVLVDTCLQSTKEDEVNMISNQLTTLSRSISGLLCINLLIQISNQQVLQFFLNMQFLCRLLLKSV